MKNKNSTRVNVYDELVELVSKIDIDSIKNSSLSQSTPDSTSTHDIDQGFITYPSPTSVENQITLKQFIVITSPFLLVGLLLFAPLPAFASQQLKQKIEKKMTATSIEELDTLAKSSGFKVFYPKKIREEIALQAKLLANKGKVSIGRKLIEVPIKRLPLFQPKFVKPEVFFDVGPEIILKEIQRTNFQTTAGTVKVPSTIVTAASLGLIQALRGRIENIRGGVLPSIPMTLNWIGNALNAKKKVGQIYNAIRGKNNKSIEKSQSQRVADFFDLDLSSTNTQTGGSGGFDIIKTFGYGSSSIFAIWYLLSIYNSSRRYDKKLPIPDFIYPDMVPEMRKPKLEERIYRIMQSLVDFKTPVPYAIIIMAIFFYLFNYSGKDKITGFTFVNTLFTQFVKMSEGWQSYLTNTIKEAEKAAKDAQNELKQEHKQQKDIVDKKLDTCNIENQDLTVLTRHLTEVGTVVKQHLMRCEDSYGLEATKNAEVFNKLMEFKSRFKGDAKFLELSQLVDDLESTLSNDITDLKTLKLVRSQSQLRINQINRLLPILPVKIVITEKKGFIYTLLDVFGLSANQPEKTKPKTQIDDPTFDEIIEPPQKDRPITNYEMDQSTSYSYGG